MSTTSNLATIAHQHGTLLFAPWPAEESIFDADTAEAIEFLSPLVGPTSTVALHYLARRLSTRRRCRSSATSESSPTPVAVAATRYGATPASSRRSPDWNGSATSATTATAAARSARRSRRWHRGGSPSCPPSCATCWPTTNSSERRTTGGVTRRWPHHTPSTIQPDGGLNSRRRQGATASGPRERCAPAGAHRASRDAAELSGLWLSPLRSARKPPALYALDPEPASLHRCQPTSKHRTPPFDAHTVHCYAAKGGQDCSTEPKGLP
jgi:hypothetical protein